MPLTTDPGPDPPLQFEVGLLLHYHASTTSNLKIIYLRTVNVYDYPFNLVTFWLVIPGSDKSIHDHHVAWLMKSDGKGRFIIYGDDRVGKSERNICFFPDTRVKIMPEF